MSKHRTAAIKLLINPSNHNEAMLVFVDPSPANVLALKAQNHYHRIKGEYHGTTPESKPLDYSYDVHVFINIDDEPEELPNRIQQFMDQHGGNSYPFISE